MASIEIRLGPFDKVREQADVDMARKLRVYVDSIDLNDDPIDVAEKMLKEGGPVEDKGNLGHRCVIVGPLKHPQTGEVVIMVQAHENFKELFLEKMKEFFAPSREFANLREDVHGLSLST